LCSLAPAAVLSPTTSSADSPLSVDPLCGSDSVTSYSNEARETIERIRDFYPDLFARWETHNDSLGFSLEYEQQPGLAFAVALVFREDDTLQLESPNFTAEFFPCGKVEVRERFVDSVCGLLDGRYRLVYFRRGNRILKAQLQFPSGNKWKTKATHYAGPWALWPWLRLSEQAVQNVADA